MTRTKEATELLNIIANNAIFAILLIGSTCLAPVAQWLQKKIQKMCNARVGNGDT